MRRVAIVGLVVVAGCSARSVGEQTEAGGDATSETTGTSGEGGTSTTTGDGGTSTDGAGSSTETSTDTGTEEGSDDGTCAFIPCVDVPLFPDTCDVWAQDCPEGFKCSPLFGTVGSGSWDLLGCVPLDPEPAQVGEACEWREGVGDPAGDTCAERALCLELSGGTSECHELCSGSPDMPTCTSIEARCQQSAGWVLNLCSEPCSPLMNDCPGDQLCVPTTVGGALDSFACFPPGSAMPGIDGEACTCANCCAPGHMCVDAATYGPDCTAESCCTALCDLNDDGPQCDGTGQSCVAKFPPSSPTLGNVGACEATP